MPVFEITSPDGRVLEIEGDKVPSESELDNIFKSIPVQTNQGSVNQSALSNVKSTDDEPEIGMSIADRFNKLRQDAVLYAENVPKKEKGMSWVEYAKLRKKYDEDWNLNTPELNPLKAIWKMSVLGSLNEKLYRGQKEKRAEKYTDNSEVLTQIPAQAQADWLKKGEIKAGEAFMRSDWSRAIPFLASGTTLDEATDIKRIIDKKNKGEELSKKEITQLNAYILDVAEQNYRGVSFGGKLIQGALELPSFAGEFMATGGLASIGKNAIQKTITKGLQDATKKEVGKRLTKGLIESAAGAVARTSLGMPQRVAENYGMRKLHDSLGITDKGQVVLETADTSPALTFLKAWGDTVIENWSEEMGAGLGEAAGLSFKGLNKLVSPLEKKLFSRNTRAAFIKAMRKLRPNATVKDIMTRAGFNGILEEMGEERAGDVLRVIFGIDDRQDISTFEKLCEAINPGAEELLLELGLFSIPGSMSFAASQVARHLRSQNVDEQTIYDYMKFSSELEKEKFLGDIIDNKDLTNAINFENSVRDLKNRYFTQNLNAGLEKEEALAAADIQSNAISSLAKNIGMDINELNKEFAINTQSLTVEQAKAQQQEDAKVLRGGIEMNVEQHNQPLYQSVENAGAAENELADATKEWQEKGTESKYFKKWFGDSKVVDETGKPLVVYHGTNADFDTFDLGFENEGRMLGDGVYLTNMQDKANKYGKNIMKLYVNIKHPFYLDEENAIKQISKNLGISKAEINSWLKYYDNNKMQTLNRLFREYDLTNKLKEKNYDGIIFNNGYEIVAFTPEQIKSVNNQGTFDSSNANIYFQSAAMRKSRFDNFADFYNDVLSKPKNTNNKEQFNALTKDGLNIRLPHDTVVHDDKRHKLSSDEWQDLLNNIDDVSYAGISKKKSRFGGIPVLLKVDTNNNSFGVVIETFAKNNPLISTAFVDTESNIEKWIDENTIKNEAVPNGTKPTFLDISLNNIITNINPKFKSKAINNKIYFQSAYHGTPHKFDEFSLDNIGTGEGAQAHGWGLYFAEDKKVSEGYREKLIYGQYESVLYDNKEITNTNTIHRLKIIYDTPFAGKKNVIDELNDAIKGKQERIKIYSNKDSLLDDNPVFTQSDKKALHEQYQGAIKNLNDEIGDCKEQIEFYNNIDIDKISIKHKTGQLYKVDIPESDVLLYEDKNYSEQTQKIKNALFMINRETKGILNDELTRIEKRLPSGVKIRGREIYGVLAKVLGSPKAASEKLNQYGVKGITYDGQQDGRCYVIFDDKAIKVLETYYQAENEQGGIDDAKGFTYQRFNFDGTTKDNLIVLLKNKSDKSTLLHEFAHVYLTTLNNLALRNDRAKELLLTVNKWLNYNGVEYTTKQHEKFANGFVAYVKSGKAPTYGLKRAFENFKRWLNDLYTNLSLSEEIELDNDTKKVFDELLGDKTIEAKDKRVEDLINKAKQNALLRLSYEYAEKRKINPLHLTEKQRRFRDTAYDILYTAAIHMKDSDGNPLIKNKQELYMLFGNSSDYQKKNKGIKHRREKIEQYLLEADDPFSGNNGFLPEWAEFFYDPGVSYENADTGADAELVKQALDVINEKRYLYDSNNLNNKNEFNEEDVKKAQYELEYLIDDYKNTKNKDITMAAFFDWADSVHPYIQEDIVTQWENRTNEIDRYENLTEFQKAKEDLKMYAATLEGYGDYSSQFAEYARKIIKRLDVMTEHDKMKIFDKLKEYNSFREIERNLDSVMDYAETLNDVSLRKNLADTIINEIKRTTPEIVKGTKKTRYDYQTNKLFERLREINRMTQEQVKDLYDAYVNGELERRAAQFEENGTITGKAEDYFEDIENSFIQFKANGIYYNSTEALQTLLDKIQNAKFTGKVARDEMDFQQRMNQQNWINNCAKAVESHKGNVGKLEEFYSMEANFDSLLSMIFDEKIKNKFSLDLLYAQVDGKVGKDRQEVLDKIADVFGYKGILKGTMLNNKFIEMANDKYTIKQRYANKYQTDDLGVWNWETVTLSKMEVLYYYIQAKNPISYEMLTDMGDENRAPKGQFDRGEFEDLLSNLSPQEKLMGDILQMAAEKYYPELNKYHIKKHHIDMGKVTCYFPRKSELKEVNELDLFNQYTEKSTNPKFVKMRSAGPSIRIAPANPVNVLFNHIQKANTIIIMGDQLDLMNKVFRDNDLKTKIKAVFGDKAYTEFMQHVTANLYDGQTITLSNAEGIISKLMSNVIATPMFIKPQIGIKQVLGLINYGLGNEHVGSIEWLKAFIKTMKHPVDAINFMMQDEYLKDRLTRANLNEAMKNQIDNKLFSRASLLNDYFSLNMRFGDLLNLCWGGKAYIDVLMSKGFTKEQAFELFRQKTISDQQSSINSTLSNLQRNSKNNPFARLLFAYQNTPHQYFRICANAIIQAKQGSMSKRQAAKTIFLYWYLLPLIFNMASSLSPITFLTTGDPDEIYTDMLVSCLGSISCIPFFGEAARALWSGITGQEYFRNRDWFTRFNQAIVSPIKKFKKDELSFGDVLKSLEIFAQGAGIPLETIDTQIEAIGDYAQGDIAKGFLKTLGYSRYRAKKVTGEED